MFCFSFAVVPFSEGFRLIFASISMDLCIDFDGFCIGFDGFLHRSWRILASILMEFYIDFDCFLHSRIWVFYLPLCSIFDYFLHRMLACYNSCPFLAWLWLGSGSSRKRLSPARTISSGIPIDQRCQSGLALARLENGSRQLAPTPINKGSSILTLAMRALQSPLPPCARIARPHLAKKMPHKAVFAITLPAILFVATRVAAPE